MLVFWEKRLVILATPKTGSTAIASALEPLAAVTVQRPAALKHTDVAQFHRYISPYLESLAGAPFTVVALMREPRDWLGSWYRQRQRDTLAERAQSTAGMSFDDFIAAWCVPPRPAFADVGTQSDFLGGTSSQRPDHIFRYERIDDFVAFLEDRLDFQILLPRLNVSPPAPLDLSPATEALLAETAAEDFRLYASLD